MGDLNVKKDHSIKLSTGKAVTPNLYEITHREAVTMFALSGADNMVDQMEFYRLVGKIYGLTAEEVADLPHPDFVRIAKPMWELLKDPLGADPN
jgi:hypothetical protein